MGGGGELARISPPKNFWKNIPPLPEGYSLANSAPKIRKNVIFPPKSGQFFGFPPKWQFFRFPPPKKKKNFGCSPTYAIKYAQFINENNFSGNESTGSAISVYFLKLCEIFKNFQKIFISLNKMYSCQTFPYSRIFV